MSDHNLDPPAGLERLEAFLRERTSDGNAYGLIADVVAWKAKACDDARIAALGECVAELHDYMKPNGDIDQAVITEIVGRMKGKRT